ncbi:MAG TPA: hypothetical protein VNC50_19100, partial [Planctomycetia bacterium]|nr:hypothetical protein [Planctomycetia bacterium]
SAAPHGVTRIDALDKQVDFADGVHDGAVVSITAERLVMTSAGSKDEHSHGLTAATRMTRDGKDCKAADLKPGMRIRVTTASAEPRAVTRIEAIDKDAEFAKAGG